MGLIRGTVTLGNPTRPELAPVEVSALADTGAVHLCIPEHVAYQSHGAGKVLLGSIPMDDMDLLLQVTPPPRSPRSSDRR
jgi:hypothetical protein